jgi:WD40 repeat protein
VATIDDSLGGGPIILLAGINNAHVLCLPTAIRVNYKREERPQIKWLCTCPQLRQVGGHRFPYFPHQPTINFYAYSILTALQVQYSTIHTGFRYRFSSSPNKLMEISKYCGAMALSPNSRWLAIAPYDRNVILWDLGNILNVKRLEGHTRKITELAFSPGSKLLVSGSSDETVKVWAVDSGECMRTLDSHSDRISAVAFSQDSKWLVSSSSDNTTRWWDIVDSEVSVKIDDTSDTIAFSPNSRLLASALWTTISISEATPGAAVVANLKGHTDCIGAMAFSPDSMRLASGSYDKTVKVWNANSGNC